MLHMTRKVGESALIGDEILDKILNGYDVKIGIQAPDGIRIRRAEAVFGKKKPKLGRGLPVAAVVVAALLLGFGVGRYDSNRTHDNRHASIEYRTVTEPVMRMLPDPHTLVAETHLTESSPVLGDNLDGWPDSRDPRDYESVLIPVPDPTTNAWPDAPAKPKAYGPSGNCSGGCCCPLDNAPRQESCEMTDGLKVFSAADTGNQPPTLASFFEDVMAPEMEAKKQSKKLRDYRNAISSFTEFLANAATTDSSRGVLGITDLHAVQWQQWQLENGLKPSTINVKWKLLRAVFRRAGKPGDGNPRGVGMIDRIPYLEDLPVPKPRPKVVPLDVINALYRFGAPDMNWPATREGDGIAASLRWRAFLCCTYNWAMRTRDMLSLTWENIHLDPQSLDPDSVNESPYGWVEWVPQKTKGKKSDPLVLPMNAFVRSHIDAIRCDGKYVFGYEMGTINNDRLYGRSGRPGSGVWPQLRQLAQAHVQGEIKKFDIKDIRKTANSAYNRLDGKLGSHVLGHAKRGVNDQFYQQWEADVIHYVAKLPQPDSFTKPVITPHRQAMLF